MLKWIPPVGKPFNKSHHATWSAMSDRERRISRVIDIVICGSVVGALCALHYLYPLG